MGRLEAQLSELSDAMAEAMEGQARSAARRAAVWEQESDALEEQVAALTQRNKELSWQVKMSADGGGGDGGAVGGGAGGAVRDWLVTGLVGCTAPRKTLPPAA